jgi:DivIVA domain-containing protein
VRLTPEEIEARRFRLAPNGYECEAVDRFLAEITETLRNQAATSGDDDEFTRVGQEIAGLLRAARASAGAVRAEADGLAASVRTRAELEAEDVRREAEAKLEQARQVLTDAEAQAEVVNRDAEHKTAEAVAAGRAAGEQEARAIVARAEEHAEELRRTERAVAQRLLAARTDLQQAIDRLNGTDEQAVVDLTGTGQPPAEHAATPTGQASGQRDVEAGDPSGDPLLRMVRAAVGRATEHSGGEPADRSAPAV